MRLLPLLALFACSTAAQPATPPVPTPTPTTDKPIIAPQPVEETPVQLGEGHCTEGETPWFSCGIDGGRTLSLCGSADGAKLQYRFGPNGNPELLFPPDSDPAKLAFRHDVWIRGYADTVHFENGGYRYELTSSIMGGADPQAAEAGNFVGVRVFEARSEVPAVQLGCTGGEPVDKLAALVESKAEH